MMSARLTAVATTSTRTSPSPATGSGTSSHTSASGPPGSEIVIACMRPTLLLVMRPTAEDGSLRQRPGVRRDLRNRGDPHDGDEPVRQLKGPDGRVVVAEHPVPS